MFEGRKKEARVQRTKKELLTELPDDDLEVDSSFLFGLFPVRFEWEIIPEPQSASYRLVERAYTSQLWHLLFVSSYVGLLVGYIGTLNSNGFSSIVFLGCAIVSLLVFVILYAGHAQLDSPVEEVFKEGKDNILIAPYTTLLVVSLIPYLLVILLEGIAQLAALTIVVGLNISYYRYHLRVTEFSYQWQSWLDKRANEFPLIASNYLAMGFFNVSLLFIFLVIHRELVFLSLFKMFPIGVPLTISLLLIPLIIGFWAPTIRSWQYETNTFQQQGNNITSFRVLVLTAVLVLAFSLGFGIVAYEFLQGAAWLISSNGTLGIYVFVLVIGSPIIFLGTGLCYQAITVARSLTTIFRKIEGKNLGYILDVDAETYVLDHSDLFAGALSLSDDYIIVSQGIIDELKEDEIAAVLAHEEAHIKHNESRIALLIALLSPLVLTGKNILYGIMDFRAREFRADRYAASRIENKQQVIAALDSLQDALTDSSEDQLSTVTPTLVAMKNEDDEPSQLKNIFEFYFGDFAFSKAHPTLTERKNQLR